MYLVLVISIILFIISLYVLIKNKEEYGVIKDCRNKIKHLVSSYPENCDYEEIKLLGKGEKADVYQTSCNGNTYAMKVTTSYTPDSFKDEVFNQKLAGSGIAPSVLDAFTCDNKKGYIVMEQLDSTVTDYIRNKTTDPTDRIALVQTFRKLAKEQFEAAAKLGVFHSDTHIDNMMIKTDELGKAKLYFIDWGISQKKTSTPAEIASKLSDLDQTFDLLERQINTNTSKTPAAPKKAQKTRQVFTERKEDPDSPPKKIKLPGFSTDSKINPIDYSSFEEIKQEESTSSPYSTPSKPSGGLQFETPTKTPQKKKLQFGDDDDSFPLIKRLTKGEEDNDDYPSAPSSPF